MQTFTRTSEYKVGDKVWLVLDTLVVKATVTEVDDTYVKRGREEGNDGGIYFYRCDEPMSHDLSADDIYKTREEAVKAFRSWHSDEEWAEYSKLADNLKFTLNDYRRMVLSNEYCEASKWPKWKRRKWCAKNFPRKSARRSWFNIFLLPEIKV